MTSQPATFAEALAKLQADLPRIPRTATGQAGSRSYKYPPYDKILSKVRPVLAKHRFAWNTRPTLAVINGETRFVLAYALTYLPTGDKDAGDFPLTEGAAQQQGSQISYAKRYALVAVLDLEVTGEDDDAAEHAPGQRGEMTRQQRTEHNRLREGTAQGRVNGATRHRAPPEDDLWRDQPAGEFDASSVEPEDKPGSVMRKQLNNINRLFNQLGKNNRDEQLTIVEDITGQPLNGPETARDGSHRTRNNLSYQQAQAVIADLEIRIEAKKAAEEAMR